MKKSNQEKLLFHFGQNLVGSSFFFDAERWSKGQNKAALQPADLVWACNGCVVLMNMTESIGSEQKMLKHNFGKEGEKFCGWLRAWKNGRLLQGKNDKTRFEIKYDDYAHKVLISVVKGPEATAEYHEDIKQAIMKKGFQVTICATVPQDVMMFLAMNNGSLADLLVFINIVRDMGKLTGTEALELLRNQRAESNLLSHIPKPMGIYQKENLHNQIEFDKPIIEDDFLTEILEQFQLLKTGSLETDKLQAALNDLVWNQLFELVHTVRKMQRTICSVLPGKYGVRSIMNQTVFLPYQFLMKVTALDSTHSIYTKNQFEDTQKLGWFDSKLPTFLLMFSLTNHEGRFVFSLGIKDEEYTSVTEKFLYNWDTINFTKFFDF